MSTLSPTPPETDPSSDQALLEAALGGKSAHQLLMEASLAERENPEERAAAIAKNRAKALELLAVLEKNLGE